jgi:hypothetical protein
MIGPVEPVLAEVISVAHPVKDSENRQALTQA